ncbi:MAG: hypothetical protein IT540_14120 [Hyphomicrobium sp.]|nr:hypothetical protein [Hyphomicrobium sp.]
MALLMLAVAMTASWPCGAAEIQPQAEGICTILLTGEIEAGDLEKLKPALQSGRGTTRINLCLDSPGGSYGEALKIIEYLLSSGGTVRTIIDAGAECFSACALVFMAGGVDTGARPDRKLHVNGVLGFHAPFIRAAQGAATPELIGLGHRAGLRAIRRLLDLNASRTAWSSNLQGKSFLPDDLVAAFLLKRPDEFLLVDTVGRAGSWQIDLFGYRKLKTVSPKQLDKVCSNDMEWAIGNGGENDLPSKPLKLNNGKARYVIPGFGDEGAWECVVDIYQSPSKGLFLSLVFASTPLDDGGDEETADERPDENHLKEVVDSLDDPLAVPGVPLWYAFDGDTPIKKLTSN